LILYNHLFIYYIQKQNNVNKTKKQKIMKKLFAIIVLVSTSLMSSAQTSPRLGNYNLSELTISSGKGAISSGLDTYFNFTNSSDTNMVLFMQANSDRVTINVGKRFGNLKLIQTFGIYKNMPWTGPMILYKLGPLDFMSWNGIIFASTDQLKDPGYNPQFFFSYEGMGLTIAKYHRVGAAVMWFGTQPMNWFVSYKGTLPIGKTSKIFGEVTYNHTLDIPMFIIGYSVKFK